MSFLHTDCPLRTDKSFRDREHPNHHKGDSIIEMLPIDMVADFPSSDPLHLLELGVMKKSLLKWINGEKGFEDKWSKEETMLISTELQKTNRELPSEIHRSVRSLKEIAFWKGSEFRTVLLYIGMVAFRDHLRKDIYDHFMLLVCSVIICSNDVYREYLPKAREMFNEYIEDQILLYGEHSLTSVVHYLIHVVDDVERFGSLNGISTYEFENHLGFIKSKVKNFNKPLEQTARRLIELANLNIESIDLDSSFKPSVKYGYDSQETDLCKFKDILIQPNVLISNRKLGNKWFLTTRNQIVEMDYAFISNDEYLIRGNVIKNKTDFFTYPFNSSYINIFESRGEEVEEGARDFTIDSFKSKLIRLSTNKSTHVFIPLIHSLTVK